MRFLCQRNSNLVTTSVFALVPHLVISALRVMSKEKWDELRQFTASFVTRKHWPTEKTDYRNNFSIWSHSTKPTYGKHTPLLHAIGFLLIFTSIGWNQLGIKG